MVLITKAQDITSKKTNQVSESKGGKPICDAISNGNR
jgi:hypothetical protein